MTLPVKSTNDDRSEGAQFISGLLARYPSPVELVLPYCANDPFTKNPAGTCARTDFGSSLWNMDSPWIMSVVLTLTLNVVLIMMAGIASGFGQRDIALGLISASVTLLVIGMPIVYLALIAINLGLAYGKRWWLRLLGPTHIGITELGFKLYVRGKLFYNYPNLALWTDIRTIEVRNSRTLGGPTVKFKYKNSYYERTIELSLDGFACGDDARRFLQHLQQYVPCAASDLSLQEAIDGHCGATDNTIRGLLS